MNKIVAEIIYNDDQKRIVGFNKLDPTTITKVLHIHSNEEVYVQYADKPAFKRIINIEAIILDLEKYLSENKYLSAEEKENFLNDTKEDYDPKTYVPDRKLWDLEAMTQKAINKPLEEDTKTTMVLGKSYWDDNVWTQPCVQIKVGDLVDVKYESSSYLGRYIGKGYGALKFHNYATGDRIITGKVTGRGLDKNGKLISNEELFELLKD